MSDRVEVVYSRGGLSVAIFARTCITAVRGPVTSELLRGDKIVSLTLLCTQIS